MENGTHLVLLIGRITIIGLLPATFTTCKECWRFIVPSTSWLLKYSERQHVIKSTSKISIAASPYLETSPQSAKSPINTAFYFDEVDSASQIGNSPLHAATRPVSPDDSGVSQLSFSPPSVVLERRANNLNHKISTAELKRSASTGSVVDYYHRRSSYQSPNP